MTNPPPPAAPAARAAVDPLHLAPHQLAGLLARAGGRPLTAAMVEADVLAGSPTHADGSLNLLHYAAWLLREESRGG